jgi:hypothetical protein
MENFVDSILNKNRPLRITTGRQWHNRENAMITMMITSRFQHRIIAISPPYHRVFTIVQLCFHHRVIVSSRFNHCASCIAGKDEIENHDCPNATLYKSIKCM